MGLKLQLGKHPSRSVNYYSKVIIIILISILVINMIVTFFTISITRQQSIDNITNIVDIYLDDTLLKLSAVEQFMIWTVKNEPLIDDIENAKDMSELPTNINNFRTRVIDFQNSTGKEYQFFLALEKENYFFNSSPILMSYSEYLKIKFYFESKRNQPNKYEDIYTWQSLKVSDKYYLYHFLQYENRTFISLIALEDILLPLQEVNLGNNGSLTIVNDHKRMLTWPKEHTNQQLLKLIFSTEMVFPQRETGLPFSLYVTVDHFSAFKQVVFAHITLVLATAIISLILYLIVRYLRRKILSPIQKFSENLSAIDNNNERIDFSSSIIELEQANAQFKGLMNEINKLKIDYYEQEFEKKQIQMDFMRLQIKPHFFLNCLTTIHSMAEMEMYQEIKQMIFSISSYFRYLFQTNQNFVSLDKEVSHVQDYLDIQKLLHGHAFHFDIHVEHTLNHVLVPPLMIQTFIENTIKHAVSLDEQINIMLDIRSYTFQDQDWIKISLRDNGPGFREDILEKLQHQKPITSSNGHHIGINNVIKRLRILFNNKYRIHFSNHPDGGAIIEIMIPQLENGERIK